MTPSQIHRQLDLFVIGQEKAKKILSVAVYNHAKRLNDKSGLIKKSNILLAGPSGCGKTLLTKTLAAILNVPFAAIDATSLTKTGYSGNDVEISLQRLVQAAGGNIEDAQKGIVYIDEIDKIARKSGHKNVRDVSGEGVQSDLLKMLEGCEVSLSIRGRKKSLFGENIIFDTTNVLFICGGAFEGLFESTSDANPIGFISSQNAEKNKKISLTSDALVLYGMMPEFIGRLPILCLLEELQENDFIRILVEPEDAIIKEYQLLFEVDGVKLTFEDEALREVAKTAIANNTGARGLRSILEDVMLNVIYAVPDIKDKIHECILTKESITTKEPVLILKQ